MNQLGVFAKYPVPGQVKTRLAASLGKAAACDVYRELLQTTLVRFRTLAQRSVLAFAPPEYQAEFEQLASGWTCQPQSSGDLGQRMRDYFLSAFKDGYQRVILIGSDSPHLPADCLSQAFDALADHDVVLGPTEDGGYYLVGMRSDFTAIFDEMPWSTPQVWPQTMTTLESLQASWSKLQQWYDVDDNETLTRLLEDLHPSTDPDLQHLRQQLCTIVAGED